MTAKIDEKRRGKFGNMIIGTWNKNENGFVWFSFWCTHVKGREGQMTPVFTSDPREAMQFVYSDTPKSVIDQINKTWPEMKLFDAPASWPLCDIGRRLLRAIYKREP